MYILSLLLLIGLFFFGVTQNNALSWYDIGPVNFQPSEFAKIATILLLASVFSRGREQPRQGPWFAAGFVIAGLPAALTLKQNDTGTALVFAPILLAMLYMAGLRKRFFTGLLIAGLLAGAIALPRLKNYHLGRLYQAAGPQIGAMLVKAANRDLEQIESSLKASDYHMKQARITLGSGRLSGKGWGKGTQSSHAFLAQARNDFIFACLGEQFGMIGCLAVALCFAFLVWRGARAARAARDMFGSLMVVGLLTIFVVHAAVNIGVAVDLLPIIGLPLPFFSYGGTFLVMQMAVFGLIINAGSRRYPY